MKGKRLVITLLVISLIVPLFSGFTAPINEVKAADVPVVNEADVTARVKELAKLLGINKGDLSEGSGVYFTVNGKQCDHAYDTHCSNCYNENVIKSDWFKKAFGYTVDVDLLPGHYYPNGGDGYNKGYTCHGFANFALWFVAKSDNKSDVYRDLLGTSKEKFSVSNLKKLDVRIGDIVRVTAGHSFMFLKYVNDSTILVLDCNSVKKNQVAIHTIDTSKKYTDSTMAVTRARNYKPNTKAKKDSQAIDNTMTLVNRPSKNIRASFDAVNGGLFWAYKYVDGGKYILDEKEGSRWEYQVNDLLMNIGDKVEIWPINAQGIDKSHDYVMDFVSSNVAVADIDMNGVVKALSNGTVTITCTYIATPKSIFGKSYAGSTSVTVKVGEEAWGLNIGRIPLSQIDKLVFVVGGDMNMSLDLPYDQNYHVKCVSDAPSILAAYNGTGNVPADIYAKRKGTTTLHITVYNDYSDFRYEKDIAVEVNNSKEKTGWDNKYYKMYGEDYVKAFGSKAPLLSSFEVEEVLTNTPQYLLNKKMGDIDQSGFIELIINKNEIAVKGIIKGKDYYQNEVRKEAIYFLINNIHESLENIDDIESFGKLFKDMKEEIEGAKKLTSALDAIKKMETKDLYISKESKKKILGALSESLDAVELCVEGGQTVAEYITTVMYLYSFEMNYLDHLQSLSSPGEALYEDVQMIKDTIYADPNGYLMKTYLTDKGAELVADALSAALNKKYTVLDIVEKTVKLFAEIAGVPKLSDLAKSTRFAEYRASIYSKMNTIRTDLYENFSTYSENQLKTRIEEYEFAYNTYLAVTELFCDVVEKLYNWQDDIFSYVAYSKQDADDYINDRYDYNRHIATMMNVYYGLQGDTTFRSDKKVSNMKLGKDSKSTASTFNLKTGESIDLAFFGATGFDKTKDAASISWTSSNTSVATVDKSTGLVKAKSTGKTEITCTVTVKSTNTTYIGKATVNVSPKATNTPTPTKKVTKTPTPTVKVTKAPTNTPKLTATPKPTKKPTNTPTPIADGAWSEWVQELPEGVNKSKYTIETTTKYYVTTTADSPAKKGWILDEKYEKNKVKGEWTTDKLKGSESDAQKVTVEKKEETTTKYLYYVYYLDGGAVADRHIWYTYSDNWYKNHDGDKVVVVVERDKDCGWTTESPASEFGPQVGGTSHASMTCYKPGYKSSSGYQNLLAYPATKTEKVTWYRATTTTYGYKFHKISDTYVEGAEKVTYYRYKKK